MTKLSSALFQIKGVKVWQLYINNNWTNGFIEYGTDSLGKKKFKRALFNTTPTHTLKGYFVV